MATAAQRTANQNNAQQSTGPQTAPGKQRASQNARRHGLLISDTRLQVESEQDYAELLARYQHEYAPATKTDQELVHTLVLTALRRRRLERAEAALLNHALPSPDGLTRQEASHALAEAYQHEGEQLDRLARYRAHADRLFLRTVALLDQRRRAHPYRAAPRPATIEIEAHTGRLPAAPPTPLLPAPAKLPNEPNLSFSPVREKVINDLRHTSGRENSGGETQTVGQQKAKVRLQTPDSPAKLYSQRQQ